MKIDGLTREIGLALLHSLGQEDLEGVTFSRGHH